MSIAVTVLTFAAAIYGTFLVGKTMIYLSIFNRLPTTARDWFWF